MKEFPPNLNVDNKDNFTIMHSNRILCYLRRDIFEHMIREDENSYFDINIFAKKYNSSKNKEVIDNIVKTIIEELSELGWKCKLSFGGTGLFIYSTDKPPPSCWEDSW